VYELHSRCNLKNTQNNTIRTLVWAGTGWFDYTFHSR